MPTTTRRRVGLAAAAATAVCAALVSGPASAATPAAATPKDNPIKTRLANSVLAESKGTAKSLAPADTAPDPTAKPGASKADQQPSKSQRSGSSVAATCAELNVQLTSTNDQVWVHWTSIPGATGYVVKRQRQGGALKQIASLGSTATSFRDKTINPRGAYTYQVVAGGITCSFGPWTMSTDNGWGEVDALFGGFGDDDLLMAQDTWTAAMPVGGSGYDPAFSPDGRNAAVTTQADDGSWDLRVVDPSGLTTRAVTWRPAGTTIPLEAAWSPDGKSLVYTLYDITVDGVVNPRLHVLTLPTPGSGRAPTDRAVAGGTNLLQADWLNSTTLVAAGGEAGQGLYTIPAAGGTAAAVTGTKNAGYPNVAPDGRIWFTDGDGTTSRVLVRATSGTISTVATASDGTWFEQPRIAPDGSVFYVKLSPVAGDPNATEFTVIAPGTPENRVTSIGATVADGAGFVGYDVRTPKSKGSSDYVGDANPEILGKSSTGVLYAYQSVSGLLDRRVSMGGGWNMFNQVVAPGDMTGDDKADVLARKPDGTLWLYRGLGGGKVQAGKQIGSGWSSFVIIAPGDFNGDGMADLLGRDSAYRLWLYPGNGQGGFLPRSLVTSGWSGFSAIIGFGDFNYDGKADFVGRERSTGRLYAYPGTGKGGITGRTLIGAGWNNLNAFAAPEFLGTTSGLFGRWNDGSMAYYENLGDGRFAASNVYDAGAGWGSFQITG